MASQITNYQCPGCTGPLEFSPTTGKLECEFCGGSYTPAEVEAYYEAQNKKAEATQQKAAAAFIRDTVFTVVRPALADFFCLNKPKII